MLQYFSENRPDTMVVMRHDIFSKFFGCPVAIDSFSIDELFQQNPHKFGVFFRMFGLLKQFFDGGYADIVAVINFGHS